MLPFKDMLILDLTHVFAGPFATYQLAALGAQVIKIEPTHNPDMTRSLGPNAAENRNLMGLQFQAQAAGKKSLALNLKTQQGQDILEKLTQKADALVQNYTINAASRLGLTPQRLHKINPRLVFCSISGYGSTGAKAHHPAYDIVIQAYTGVMHTNGTPNTAPLRIGPAVIDYGTGAQAALAIAAALFMREKTAKGTTIDVAMADCALMLMNYHTNYTLETGQTLKPVGNNDTTMAGYGAYETQDGLIMLGAYTIKQMAELMHALGEHKHAEDILKTPLTSFKARTQKDSDTIAKACLKTTATELEHRLNAHHVPAARVRSLEEALDEDHIKNRNVIQKINGKAYTTAGFTYENAPPRLACPPPRLGQDSTAILKSLGYQQSEIDQLHSEGVIVSEATGSQDQPPK